MSGYFVHSEGNALFLKKHSIAAAALANGLDLVLELPMPLRPQLQEPLQGEHCLYLISGLLMSSASEAYRRCKVFAEGSQALNSEK
jgi:hypothetical protein